MRTLCESHGTQLVLIKAPSLYPIWWEEWEEQMEDYARKYDLLYVNLLEAQAEIGLDWETDTYDAGLHLNIHGAEKLRSRQNLLLRKLLSQNLRKCSERIYPVPLVCR